MNWTLLQNSLLVASLTTLLALSFGFATAICAFGVPRPARRFILGTALVTLALPPFLVTNSWLHFLGPTGVWRGWLPFHVQSLPGAVWIMALLLWPIPMLATMAALGRLESRQLESDLAVAGWPLVSRIIFPLARAALAQAALLTFVLAFNNFSVPAVLQVKTYPSEVWIRFNTNFDAFGAAILSIPMVLISIVVLILVASRGVGWSSVETTVSSVLFRQQLGRSLFASTAVISITLALLSAAMPLMQLLLVRRTWTELPGALAAGQTALWNSFWLPASCAALAMSISMLGGMGAVNPKIPRRMWDFLSAFLWLPFFVPGVLLGIVWISLFNRPGMEFIYRGAGILVLALVVRYLAFGWNVSRHAFRNADPDLAEAAQMEGASFGQRLRYAYWPQIGRQLAAGWYILFLLGLWDVESILLIIPPRIGETLSLRIFNLLHYGHNAQVNALCLTMVVLALLPLFAWTLYSESREWITANLRKKSATLGILLLIPLAIGCGRSSSGSGLHSLLFNSVQVVGTRGVGVGQLNKPRSVAVDSQDNLYVVDMTGRVQKFSTNGSFILSWQMPQTDLGKPKGMCRDRQGNIVVVEPHYSRVNHFSTGGQLLLQWGVRGTNDGQLSVPRAVGIDSANEAFVTEYLDRERVQKFGLSEPGSAAGPKWLAGFGKPGTAPGEFNRPEGLCVDSLDQVYVADSCNHRIQVFSREGKLLRIYGKPGKEKGELSYPYDICVDSAGRQYVCEFGNSRIQVFDAHDQPIEIIGERGAEPGQFSNPWGVALDSAGNLYVADSQNHRVQKLIRNRAELRQAETPKPVQQPRDGLKPTAPRHVPASLATT